MSKNKLNMYYLCYKPDGKPGPGVVAYIYHAIAPRFFARVEKLGEAEPISELSYRGIRLMGRYCP